MKEEQRVNKEEKPTNEMKGTCWWCGEKVGRTGTWGLAYNPKAGREQPLHNCCAYEARIHYE